MELRISDLPVITLPPSPGPSAHSCLLLCVGTGKCEYVSVCSVDVPLYACRLLVCVCVCVCACACVCVCVFGLYHIP